MEWICGLVVLRLSRRPTGIPFSEGLSPPEHHCDAVELAERLQIPLVSLASTALGEDRANVAPVEFFAARSIPSSRPGRATNRRGADIPKTITMAASANVNRGFLRDNGAPNTPSGRLLHQRTTALVQNHQTHCRKQIDQLIDPSEKVAFVGGNSHADGAIDPWALTEVHTLKNRSCRGVEGQVIAQGPILRIGFCGPGTIVADGRRDERGKGKMKRATVAIILSRAA